MPTDFLAKTEEMVGFNHGKPDWVLSAAVVGLVWAISPPPDPVQGSKGQKAEIGHILGYVAQIAIPTALCKGGGHQILVVHILQNGQNAPLAPGSALSHPFGPVLGLSWAWWGRG